MLNIRELALAAFICYVIYKYIIYPAFLSPLCKIPNAHPTSSVSPLWILWTRHQFKEVRSIHAAHVKHGPVVRLGPNELSVNCVDDGIRTIYAGGFEKHTWYPNLFPNYDNVPNMFSTAEGKPHSVRKRMLSNIYSKSYLQSSPTMTAVSSILIHQRLLPMLQAVASSTGEMDMHFLFNTITMDFVTAYIFGVRNSSNFIENVGQAKWWLDLYQCRKKFVFWWQELPQVAEWCWRIGIHLSPVWVAEANSDLEQWCLKLCDGADETLDKGGNDLPPEDIPVVYRQLKSALETECARAPNTPMTPKDSSQQRLSRASELLDELSAGEETSAITLTYLFHELCLHPELQESLRKEVRTLSQPLYTTITKEANEHAPLPSSKAIDNLPLLHATLMETLRLHAAIPGPEPRITPNKPNVTLGPFTNIPANVRVSSQPYTLHRNSDVFPDPESFLPDRWLTTDEKRKAEMHRWFWTFSSGGRMCIGSNLAMQEMKLVTAALLSNFRFSIIDDEGIEQEDAYTAQPTGQKLVLRIQAVGE